MYVLSYLNHTAISHIQGKENPSTTFVFAFTALVPPADSRKVYLKVITHGSPYADELAYDELPSPQTPGTVLGTFPNLKNILFGGRSEYSWCNRGLVIVKVEYNVDIAEDSV